MPLSVVLKNLEFLEDGEYRKIVKSDPMSIVREGLKALDELERKCTYFPNAILVQDSDSTIGNKSLDPVKPVESVENIWDIVMNLKNEEKSKNEDESIPSQKKCKECGGINFIEDYQLGHIVCSECGVISAQVLDYGPEWRQYSNDDYKGDSMNRCGCPVNFFFPRSFQGTLLTGHHNTRIRRKQKWSSIVYKEKTLNTIFEFVSDICFRNGISRIIVDTFKTLYKLVNDSKHKMGKNTGKYIITRGKKRMGIQAACLFRACEMNKEQKSDKDIASLFGINEKKLSKGLSKLDDIIQNTEDLTMIDQMELGGTEDCIRRYSSKLKLTPSQITTAIKISHNCCEMKLVSDHNSQSIAAGAVLLMVEYYKLSINKQDICKLFEITDVTINKIYNKIEPYVYALVDDEITAHIIKKFKING